MTTTARAQDKDLPEPLRALTPPQSALLDKHARAHGDDHALDLVIACPGCRAAIAAPCTKQAPGVVCFARRLKRLLTVGRWKTQQKPQRKARR